MAMRTRFVFLVSATVAMMFASMGASAQGQGPSEEVQERFYDKHGRLIAERGIATNQDDLGFERHYYLVGADRGAKPAHAGGGGGNGGGGGDDSAGDPGTDCESDKYSLGGWWWAGPYRATATSYASVFDAAGRAWDDSTSASIFGGIAGGSAGVAGTQDFVNQIDFVALSSTSTIAVTTTWYYISTNEAVESDAQYNTYFSWSTTGATNSMDVQAIGTHEIGHSFGLDHPNGNPRQIGCLTMYAYGSAGSTMERTLGDGDILGIQAIYGA